MDKRGTARHQRIWTCLIPITVLLRAHSTVLIKVGI
jgi:hypothetical protein